MARKRRSFPIPISSNFAKRDVAMQVLIDLVHKHPRGPAGTLTKAAQAVMDQGAKTVSAITTHPVLSGPAVDRIVESPLQTVVVTDTIPLSPEAVASGKMYVVSVSPLFAEAIRAIHHHDSVSRLFD